MEKLIELLNEYENKDLELEEWEESNARTENNWHLRFNGANKVQFDTYMFDSLALSKQYWFIKWLVENNKLKWTDKMEIRKIMLWMPEKQDYYIMMLAVTPQPIEFLVSILK